MLSKNTQYGAIPCSVVGKYISSRGTGNQQLYQRNQVSNKSIDCNIVIQIMVLCSTGTLYLYMKSHDIQKYTCHGSKNNP